MIRSIALGALAATSALALSPAPAAASYGHINGYEVTYLYDSGTLHTWDNINIVGPYGLEYITVRCAPFDWKSSGPNTSQFVDSIVRSWCF